LEAWTLPVEYSHHHLRRTLGEDFQFVHRPTR